MLRQDQNQTPICSTSYTAYDTPPVLWCTEFTGWQNSNPCITWNGCSSWSAETLQAKHFN